MLDGYPVIDAVVHAYNNDPSNYANEFAKGLGDLVQAATYATSLPGYRIPRALWHRDWSMEEVAKMSFLEGHTDIAVHHVLPIRAYKEGLCSIEKTLEAKERWPDRFVVYCGVDPLEGQAALDDLERQVEVLRPAGLKLYPNSWAGEKILGWFMDDPEVAFPLFDRARELGIKVVAIHKAVPLGPVPLEHYRMDDIDRAAIEFPDLTFEVVHGGMAFLEETAWQLARFPNVYVNLEITTSLVAVAPAQFARAMATMLRHGGPAAIDRILWGTGAMAYHPRPHVEAFIRDFTFPSSLVEDWGIPPLTAEAKRKILAENYARMIGFDLKERLSAIEDDEFARQRGADPLPPYSTTAVAGHAE